MAKEETRVTDEELISALKHFQQSSGKRSSDPLYKLLDLVVDRLVETSTVFNDHEHPVRGVRMDSCEYYSAGDGHTGSPASAGGYGCNKEQRIG
jgi:hypothetical protein